MVKIYFLLLSCLIATSSAYFFDECTSSNNTYNNTVNTLNGPIEGTCYTVPVSYSNNTNASYDVLTWLSIPYAMPPIGQNRFLKPLPVQSWTEVLETKEGPATCPQKGANYDQQSEDCLYLNIFVRGESYLKKASDLRPVLIYIHGGGFIEG